MEFSFKYFFKRFIVDFRVNETLHLFLESTISAPRHPRFPLRLCAVALKFLLILSVYFAFPDKIGIQSNLRYLYYALRITFYSRCRSRSRFVNG